jgi:hypothetical protein
MTLFMTMTYYGLFKSSGLNILNLTQQSFWIRDLLIFAESPRSWICMNYRRNHACQSRINLDNTVFISHTEYHTKRRTCHRPSDSFTLHTVTMNDHTPTSIDKMIQFDKMNPFASDVTDLTRAATGPLSKVDIVRSMALLPESFVPGDNDVICGRGRKCFNHSGNERFRVIVSGYLDKYSTATSKLEKSFMLSDIVAEVRKCSPNGGFVKKCPETKRFYEVGCFLAREKTSQAFRDALHDQYKSSNSAKKKRRQVSQATKLQKAYSASNIGYDASEEPLDAYTATSAKFMRVERRRSFCIEKDPLTGNIDSMDISEFGNKRRGLTSQGFKSAGSARSVLDFRKSGPDVDMGACFNRSCPDLSNNRAFQDFNESSESFELESNKAFADDFKSCSKNSPNPFFGTKPYVSLSSRSLMSVEEDMPEELVGYRGFEGRGMEQELTMDRLLLQPEAAPSDCHLLASLSKLIYNVDIDGDPFAPVPLPDISRH